LALAITPPAAIGIEACDSGQIYTSLDLSFWTPQNSQTTNSLQAIAFLGNRIIIAGQSGTMVYSDDGYTYNYTNLNTANWLVGVAASSNLAVAVGDNAVIYTSADGAQWTLRSTPPDAGANWLLAAAYGAGTFVIAGQGGYIATSTNATTWTHRSIAGLTADINDVEWISNPNASNGFAADSFLAVCDNGKAYYSINAGSNWTVFTGTGTNALYTAAGNYFSRLAAGENTVIFDPTSTTLAWREQTSSSVTTNPAVAWTYYSAASVSNLYAVGGDTGMFVTGTPDPNGEYDWSSEDLAARDWLWQVVAVSNLIYVAVGDNARIMSSLDGVDWSIEEVTNGLSVSLTNTVFFGVGGTTNLLLAVGTGGSMAYSPNHSYAVVTTNDDGSLSTNTVRDLGIEWDNLPALETNNDLHAVAVWGGNYFVTGGGGTIYSSSNPTNPASWTLLKTPTTNYLSGIDSFSNTLVCVGNGGTILTSSDGVSWTQQNSPVTNWIYRVHNCGAALIAVGENGTILASSNAVNWTLCASGTTNWLNDVQVVSNRYYVVGDFATVLTSTNTVSWTGVPMITDQSLYSAATMEGQLVTVGLSGIILRSQIVADLNPLDIISFAADASECVFFVGTTDGGTDVSFTLDSSPDLVNWTTGPQINITDDSGTVLFSVGVGANAAAQQFYRATLVPQN
jgi:hypothetical protein